MAPVGLPDFGRPVVMGILNVTPDSFSDGGRWVDRKAAVEHALSMVSQGAQIIDVGGESTRPGAQRVPAAVEQERIEPVVAELAAAGVCVSLDTMRSEVAKAGLEAGAQLINDVSGGLADPQIRSVVAAHNVPYIVMHWRAHSHTMQQHAHYTDVVTEVVSELGDRVEEALAAGIGPDRIIVDPGIGFAKESEHNWALLRALPRLGLGQYPILVGASRKRFLGGLLSSPERSAALDDRDVATAAVSLLAIQAGAWAVRVHNVQATMDALAVLDRWEGQPS